MLQTILEETHHPTTQVTTPSLVICGPCSPPTAAPPALAAQIPDASLPKRWTNELLGTPIMRRDTSPDGGDPKCTIRNQITVPNLEKEYMLVWIVTDLISIAIGEALWMKTQNLQMLVPVTGALPSPVSLWFEFQLINSNFDRPALKSVTVWIYIRTQLAMNYQRVFGKAGLTVVLNINGM